MRNKLKISNSKINYLKPKNVKLKFEKRLNLTQKPQYVKDIQKFNKEHLIFLKETKAPFDENDKNSKIKIQFLCFDCKTKMKKLY